MTRRFAIFIAFRFHNSPLFVCQSVQYDKKTPQPCGWGALQDIVLFLEALVALGGQTRADGLEDLHQNDEQNDRREHHEILVAVVAVVDGDLAEAAAADDAAHRRVAENGRERDGHIAPIDRQTAGNCESEMQ